MCVLLFMIIMHVLHMYFYMYIYEYIYIYICAKALASETNFIIRTLSISTLTLLMHAFILQGQGHSWANTYNMIRQANSCSIGKKQYFRKQSTWLAL